MVSVADLRREYTLAALTEETIERDPVSQFRIWFDQAVTAQVHEPNAMSLATVGADGTPAVRIVLLKGFDERGFVFFTNYQSAKGRELEANPSAALVFFWPELERQVRITGKVERTSREESVAYFSSRPRQNQIGAHVSRQGEVIANRQELAERLAEVTREFEGEEVPTPAHWGGFRVKPESVEFWQGGPGRLHDRIRYRREGKPDWLIERLCP